MKMKDELSAVWKDIAIGNMETAPAVAGRIKEMDRRENGLFVTADVDENLFAAACLVYPVYAAYETECNKKEGYPDLLAQFRALSAELKNADTLENRASFLDALIHTVDNVSPQLYEYYRELVDMFKETVGETVKKYYRDGHFKKADGSESPEAEKQLRAAIAHAADTYVLLGEKYEKYC